MYLTLNLSSIEAPVSGYVVPDYLGPDSAGDCTLRSCDKVCFKVSRLILSLGSPFFKDLFALPQPANESNSSIPVIDITEDADTIGAVLQILYPVNSPSIKTYSLAAKLIEAFKKYLIETQKLMPHILPLLSNDRMKTHPMGVYAICWRLGYTAMAKTASRYTHSVNIHDRAIAYALVQQAGSLDALLALLDLRARRDIKFDALFDQLGLHLSDSGCPSGHPYMRILNTAGPHWATSAKARMKSWMDQPYPSQGEVTLGILVGNEGKLCHKCFDGSGSPRRPETMINVKGLIAAFPQEISGCVLLRYWC